MQKALLLTLLFPLAALAGCVGAQGPGDGLEGDRTGPSPFALAEHASAGDPVWMMGSELIGPDADNENAPPPFLPMPPRPQCDGVNCERLALWIGDTADHDVTVTIEWEAQDETWDTGFTPGAYLGAPAAMLDAVITKDGHMVADVVESFHYGGVAVLEDPEPGEYEIETVARYGQAAYMVAAGLQAPNAFNQADAAGDILPDLVAIPPDHPTFRFPIGHEAGTPGGALVGGCGPDETLEDQHRRCLRFAGIIGNQGPGEFRTVLEYDQAAASIAAPSGHWDQVIQRSDGSSRQTAIGAADYHVVHGHFHILDFVATQLYTYDLETEERGDAVGDGHKMGFCTIDGGLVNALTYVTPPAFNGNGCCYIAGTCQLDMLSNDEFVMGMSANWYDIYPWWRSDQYVEASDLEGGVYELVSVINPDGLIEEMDYDNNEASTVIRVSGETVEIVSQSTQAEIGPHPDADWGYAGDDHPRDRDRSD